MKIFLLNRIKVLGLILLFACSANKETDCIDLGNENSISLFDIFSEAKVVELETRDESMMGMISRALFYKDRYYLLDAQSQQLFCFDDAGGFKYKVSSQGAGPGEYNYITDFNIDPFNERLMLLDPVMQRVLFFNLEGKYLATQPVITEKVMGYNKVFALSDSIILITSITYDQLVFFSVKENRVIHSTFECPVEGTLQAFYPGFNVYQLDKRTYALPALSQELYEVTDAIAVPYFRWCFGADDNSEKQITALIEQISTRSGKDEFWFHHQAVGKEKILNQFILKIYESSRFRMAILEYENNYVHAVVDKATKNNFVFKNFKEGISLLAAHVSSDRIIAHETGHRDYFKKSGIPELENRRLDYFSFETLSAADRHIIAKHNPMTDNPFLVVYKFKE